MEKEVVKKIKINDSTLGDMIEYLRAEAVTNGKGSVGVTAVRMTATRIFRAVYGFCWRDVAVADVDTEKLFEEFVRSVAGEKYGIHTLDTYHKRLKRAFDIYDMRDKKIEVMKVATEEFEREVERLMSSINSAREAFMNVATHYLFTDEARKGYEVYAIPVEGMNPVALALPKEMDDIDVDMVKGMVERMCSRIRVRKERRLVTQNRLETK